MKIKTLKLFGIVIGEDLYHVTEIFQITNHKNQMTYEAPGI